MGTKKTPLTDNEAVNQMEAVLSEFLVGSLVYAQDNMRSHIHGKGRVVAITQTMEGDVLYKVRLNNGGDDWFYGQEMKIING